MNCPNCGKQIQDNAKFCMGCGNRIPDEINGLISENIPAVAVVTAGKETPKAPVRKEKKPQASEPAPKTEPPRMLMPNCVGMHYDEAVKALEDIPCSLSFIYEYSDTVAENYVLDQNLAADSELTAEKDVMIYVSKGPDVAPEGYNQKVTVTAASGSSYGTLTLYEWENGQWVSKFECDATLGSNGISADYGEGRKKSPGGVFKLGVALTANNLSNSSWPVHLVTSDTCVVDDVDSSAYNTIQSIKALSSGVSYDPIGRTITQGFCNVCIYIEHNGDGYSTENVVAGKGSVITLCGRNADCGSCSGAACVADEAAGRRRCHLWAVGANQLYAADYGGR